MNADEINELLDLKGWSTVDLASAMHLSSDAVYKWLRLGSCPRGPSEVLMRIWLAEAKAVEPKNGKPKRLAHAK